MLRRLGLGRLSALEPPPPAVRYEHAAAGQLPHLDSKKLGRIKGPGHSVTGDGRGHRARGIGWEHLHDASRLAYTELLPDERGATCAGFLARAAWFASLGVRIERAMTECLGHPQKAFDRSRLVGYKHTRE